MIVATKKCLISIFGFSPPERRALQSIFNLTTARGPTYNLVRPEERITGDIALVDADDPQAIKAWQLDRESHSDPAPAVIVTRDQSPNWQQVAISRPLTMRKVLGALDHVNMKRQVSEEGISELAHENAPANTTVSTESAFCALVVDDSLSTRKFMETKLASQEMPVNVDFAASGEQAIGMVKQRHYDIIFLDVILPGIDGYRVCKSIKAEKNASDSAVIMLTSKKSPFDRVKGSMAGCDAYLTKPPNEERLDAIIRRYMLNIG